MLHMPSQSGIEFLQNVIRDGGAGVESIQGLQLELFGSVNLDGLGNKLLW